MTTARLATSTPPRSRLGLRKPARAARLFATVLRAVQGLQLWASRLTPPPFRLVQIGSAYWQSRALGVVTELDVASQLGDDTVAIGVLAQRCNVMPDGLQRVLRLLAALGVFEEAQPGHWRNNRGSAPLRADRPGSVRDLVLLHQRPEMRAPWNDTLASALRLGRPAFEVSHGQPLFEHMATDPALEEAFAKAMAQVEGLTGTPWVDAIDWRAFHRLLDVGGSAGDKALTLLARHAHLHALVIDRPATVEAARFLRASETDPQRSAARARLSFHAADVRQDALPPASSAKDVFWLSALLHGMSDADALQVLQRVARAAAPVGATVLVMEAVRNEEIADLAVSGMDLQMAVCTEGARTQPARVARPVRPSPTAVARTSALAHAGRNHGADPFMKRILITAMGSHGDVLPFISMAAEFRRRGFEVFVYANSFFADSAASCGAVFRPIGTVADYEGLFAQAPDSNPPKAMAAVAGYMARQTPACYRAMYGDVRPGRTLVIGGSLFFAHRLVAETLGVPCATVHLAPAAIRSTIAPARTGPGGAWLREKSPFWLRQLFWWLADRAHTDRYFLAPLNSMRTQLGLAPLPELFSPWLRQVDAEVALFPAWFSGAPADWPAQLQHCDFPFDDPACAAELPDELRDFLVAGPAPVGFTAGTATANAREFFARSARACEQGGLRGLLLTHFAQQVPDKLPPGVLHVGYAPYARLLPRLAALVHHGGIGTTAQALRAGIPQVVRPTAYDQFDNAQRLVALNVAREILPRRYTESHICNTLAELMHDTTVRAQCQAIAEQMRPAAATNAGIASACEAVLSGCGWPPGTVADPVG